MTTAARNYHEGRDEMNLADFPIAALQRAQKGDGNGGKLDQIVFRATRYDPALRQRVSQKATLTSAGRAGLPTPARKSSSLPTNPAAGGTPATLSAPSADTEAAIAPRAPTVRTVSFTQSTLPAVSSC